MLTGAAAMVVALASGALVAQGPLMRAAMDVAVDPDANGASVTIEYRLATTPGPDSVRFAMILFDSVRTGAVSATVNGRPVANSGFLTDDFPRITGTLVLPASSLAEHTVVVRYDVRSVAGRYTRIPVLAALRPPAEALPGIFTATVDLPAAWYASDGTPAGFNERTDGNATRRRYDVSLQVVPALVGFRLADNEPSVLGRRTLINAAVLLFLVAAGRLGWRHFVAGG